MRQLLSFASAVLALSLASTAHAAEDGPGSPPLDPTAAQAIEVELTLGVGAIRQKRQYGGGNVLEPLAGSLNGMHRDAMHMAAMGTRNEEKDRPAIAKDLVAASATPLVLAILRRGDSYGYAIIQEVRELSGGRLAWTDGMLYPICIASKSRV